MKTALCYGDSNTFGTIPMASWADDRRFPQAERWPNVMAAALGQGWQVIAEGLPGRTTVHPDPIEGEHKSGLPYLRPCLESHRPIDLVALMLGTNDFKRRFSLEAEDVAWGVGRLVAEMRGLDVFAGQTPRILIVCPPPIAVVGIFKTMFEGADRRSRELPSLLREVATSAGAGFLDAGEIISPSPIDGIHFEAEAHGLLGRAVAAAATALLGEEGGG